jgi:hypothetical protein
MAAPDLHSAVVAWEQHRDVVSARFAGGEVSFLEGLLPELAVKLGVTETVDLLRRRYGGSVDLALGAAATDPQVPATSLPPALAGPVVHHTDGAWLRRANLVGINVRTIGTLWHVIPYSLTLPAVYDGIHLLPIWEPGVVSSLYGLASWEVNTEFFSPELAEAFPHLDRVQRQLRAVVNLLHVTGRVVGMDVIPHTDRFSEMALAQPSYFEWMRRRGDRIVDHADRLHEEVEHLIESWLAEVGPAEGEEPPDRETLFRLWDEPRRLRVLFGPPGDRRGRTARRAALVERLHGHGLEPVPATMGVPFRGLAVDPESGTTDQHGLVWRDYLIERSETMSRVFNPLARYKLYGRLDDNADWEVDFSTPRTEVWEDVCGHYADIQAAYGFDFMRGDMSHVQMRPGGVPAEIDEHYDIPAAVKRRIRDRGAAWFGYFAESFLPPRDVFGYGEELDHLEASDADTTLGDLQSSVVGSNEFISGLRRYLDIGATRSCVPCFTLMTGDKDDPRFDEFYRAGNEVRMFLSLLLPDVPSYVALGFETRDVHLSPAPNEHYTKLFVFHEDGDSNVYPSKARSGPYVWGRNVALFERLTRLRSFVEEILTDLEGTTTRWLLPPDACAYSRVVAWTQEEDPRWLFVANLDVVAPSRYFGVPGLAESGLRPVGVFSTHGEVPPEDRTPRWNGRHHRVENLEPGEARAYRLELIPAERS